ncbi:MAG TPA: hypothetical protein VFC56_13760 [Stellaceae bacterium]|nr:hypothetical protein [Stellaceae bacterium]
MNYGFTVEVAGIDIRGDYEAVLYEAGCGDALVVVAAGALFLDFHRDAKDFESAVASASRSVESAGGRVVTIAPLSEQADRPLAGPQVQRPE